YCTPSYQSSSCPGFSSCLRSIDVQQQFLCCVPRMSITVRDGCLDPMGTVELFQGVQRKCLPNTNACSYGSVSPVCPNDGVPQPWPTGYRNCSINSINTQNDCEPGYACVRAVNDFSIQLCCSFNSASEPVCPNQGFLLK
ncbi:hypothetical protein GCK32_019117, partial [Trichostrongylus colubriformis]